MSGDDSPEDLPEVSPDDETLRRAGGDTKTLQGRRMPLDLAPGTVLGNRYRIVSKLGRGGMGEVYRADDLKLGQPVALKFVAGASAASPERQRLVLNEVRIGREISHPNVCRLHDIVEIDGQIFISMEFVDGEDLASLLRRIGSLPSAKVVGITRDLCAGLAVAHEKGIVHRDLKPSNVMIDGRGRARITDFGLAAFEQSAGEDGRISGTPQYMAPEQLHGEPPTTASDLFAVGLIVCEMITGRRIVEGTSLEGVVRGHENLQIPNLALAAPDLDASTVSVIVQCLAPEPKGRPSSAAAILAALPGGDALAAAEAAGETPSPAMVAAASESGRLSPARAWATLGLVIACSIIAVILQGRVALTNRVPLPKSPEILAERAREILGHAGLPHYDGFGHTASWFVDQPSLISWVSHNVPPEYRWDSLGEPPLTPILFQHRESPRSMVASNRRNAFRITASDPPLVIPGMVMVTLDPGGSLVGLVAVPPAREPVPEPAKRFDWATLLDETGLNTRELTEVEPEWAAPVDSDAKRAWAGVAADGETPIRVEAASYHGRPSWLSVVHPWDSPGPEENKSGALDRIGIGMNIAFLIVLPIAAYLLARRNLRRGQVDKRGAVRLSIFVLCVLLVARALRANHVATFSDEWVLASFTVAECTFWALNVLLAYVAIEPFVRRRMPRSLISWNRLLDGRFADPMIGRDLVVGFAAGGLMLVATNFTLLVPEWIGLPATEPWIVAVTPYGSSRHVGFFLFWHLFEAIARTFAFFTFYIALRGFIRNRKIVITIIFVCAVAGFLADFPGSPGIRIACGSLAALTLIIVALRFGFLALVSAAYMILAFKLPLTFDLSSWYFGRSAATLATLAIIAVWAFVTSLGGKPIFGGLAFDE